MTRHFFVLACVSANTTNEKHDGIIFNDDTTKNKFLILLYFAHLIVPLQHQSETR